jgi:hypothetical protein
MKKQFTDTQDRQPSDSFEMFRISRSKEIVDLCPNSLRKFHKQGLAFYKRGKSVFISKTELAAFIRAGATKGTVAS